MILHGKCQVGTTHGAPRPRQFRKSMRRMKIMQHMPVDINQLTTIGAAADEMKIPDLVEKGRRTPRLIHYFAPMAAMLSRRAERMSGDAPDKALNTFAPSSMFT